MEKRNLSYWWFPLIFGVIFIVLGIWILRAPVESLTTLTKVIGVITVVSGTTQLLFTGSNRQRIPGWGFQATGGVVDLVIGVILIINPEILLKIITFFVAFWLIVNSVNMLMLAGKTRKAGRDRWRWEMIIGIALLLLAILFLWHPLTLGITIAIWTALAFIFLGLFRIILTFRLRKKHSP